MASHVEFRQLDSDGEDLDSDDDAGCLLQDLVAPFPPSNSTFVSATVDIAEDGCKPAENTRTDENAKQEGDRRLAQVQAIANEAREESVKNQEKRYKDVGDVRRRRLDHFPDHVQEIGLRVQG